VHPQAERAPQAEQNSNFFEEMGEIWTVGVVNFVVLACVLRATTKKVVNFLFGGRKVHAQRESWLSLCVWFSSALCYTGLRSWA